MDASVFAASCTIFTISLVAVGLRFHSRRLTKCVGWDDWFILAAVVVEIALFAVSIYLWNEGYYRVSPDQIDRVILCVLLVFETLYLCSMCFTKLSAIYLYTRIFIHKSFRVLCLAIGSIIILLYIAVLVQVFTLSEVAADLWGNPIFGHVVNSKKVDIGNAVFNGITNLVVLLLPIPPIWSLKMRVRSKINLTILFGLGLCVTVVSCIRISALVRADKYITATVVSYGSRDMHLRVLEPELAIFSLCLPVLRPLWLKVRENYGYVTKQFRSGRQSSKLAPSEEDDEEHLLYFSGPIASTVTSISANTPIRPIADKGLYDIIKEKSKSIFSGNSVRLPKPAVIKVEKTWQVSYLTTVDSR
ncbi:hypothetical protein F5Y00DRAFT_262224 [Daldinia vernicosa]|uniref:uncharacterized protein n=1 Tax=Daldinia vernicosa TaxID=114800 RepID=UPI00200869FB|nr:uncharacterized protein F5Y00DRAFT_262224 [Daldinia vernicosa]KAI0848755.1 hypothetical protein F5Y00DRAFT_262224 [Daldinia vernicosa]